MGPRDVVGWGPGPIRPIRPIRSHPVHRVTLLLPPAHFLTSVLLPESGRRARESGLGARFLVWLTRKNRPPVAWKVPTARDRRMLTRRERRRESRDARS